MSDNFLDLAMLDEIPDEVLLEDGSKHTLTVLKAEIGESGEDRKTAGQKYLRVMLKSVDEPDSRPFSEVFMLPFRGEQNGQSLDKDQFNMRGRQLREFFEAFDFNYKDGWNIYTETDALKGLEGEAIVKVSDNGEWGEQNSVKKFV